jgi:rubrerythrin
MRAAIAKNEKRAADRMNVCRECDKFTGYRCRVCGCVMAAKTRIPSAKCPLGRWPVFVDHAAEKAEN